jgi:hypothetical protein
MEGRIPRGSAVGETQLWAPANRARYRPGVPTNRLAALAIALAAVAVVLLPLSVLRRCRGTADESGPVTVGSGSESAEVPLPRPAPQSLIDSTVATMFGAICRHQVKCGIGTLDRCDYVESTMKQMPKSLAVRPCPYLDVADAKRCIDDIAVQSCGDFAKSLDVLDLQLALDRVRSCRLACE